jgi:hypothetical protein
MYPHGWHLLTRDLGAAVVHADLAAWLGDARRPLPSGLDAASSCLHLEAESTDSKVARQTRDAQAKTP